MSPNWQHFIACAFDRVPHLGVCGIDYRGSVVGELLMSRAINVPIRRVADIEFRTVPGCKMSPVVAWQCPQRSQKKSGRFRWQTMGECITLRKTRGDATGRSLLAIELDTSAIQMALSSC